jgi:hypothetical protein
MAAAAAAAGGPIRRRRVGSNISQLEQFVLQFVAAHRGTPTVIAMAAAFHLGRPCTRQEVWRVLKQNGYTKKTSSVVPRLSVPNERRQHLLMLRLIWHRADMVPLQPSVTSAAGADSVALQLVFLDEKKFRSDGIITRAMHYGYSASGERLPIRYAADAGARQSVFSSFFSAVVSRSAGDRRCGLSLVVFCSLTLLCCAEVRGTPAR